MALAERPVRAKPGRRINSATLNPLIFQVRGSQIGVSHAPLTSKI